jgi:S1-C subfamily serine protease
MDMQSFVARIFQCGWALWLGLASSVVWAQNNVATPRAAQLENAVVKIFTTARGPDVFRPWSRAAPSEMSGSGVVIAGQRILTNAHVVSYASKVEVQAREGGDRLQAKVVAIARGIDLAVLELEDTSFFTNHTPPARANVLPEVKDAVLAYGYPVGGNSLSITKGIVSRIEYVSYNYPTSGLRIQIDAAINPGNSGGPVFVGNKMIGLAYAGASNTQNIGYIIPNEEVDIFLKDIADGQYDGKPALFDDLQTLENPALRTFLKVDKTVRGMVVQRTGATNDESPLKNPLKEWDIITHIGDIPIDNQGMVKVTEDLNVRFHYRVQQVAKNGRLPLTIIRDGKVMKVEVPLVASPSRLIGTLDGKYPSYFVYGPMVFSRATWEFRTFFNNNAGMLNGFAFNAQPLLTRVGDEPTPEREDLVVVSAPFFPHRLMSGYDNRFGSVVYSVNNVPIRSLRHLVEVLRDLKDDLVLFKFDQRSSESIVLPRQKLVDSTEEVLNENGIRYQATSDLLEVWQAKKP